MTLSGSVDGPAWHVSVQTSPGPGGFVCTVRVAHDGVRGSFQHEFEHMTRHTVEREAMLAGLREGMMWIDHKVAHSFDF
jgi:ribonuclease HI